MKPVNKNIGFAILMLLSIGHSVFGNEYLAAAFFISALFYDSITNTNPL